MLPLLSPELSTSYIIDQIIGQEEAKRAVVISAAGRHPLLLTGVPGVGKTMLAQATYELLPKLSREELVEIAEIYGLAGLTVDLIQPKRPLRMPHHTLSLGALLGGASSPGELSLAHGGLLFLDEFPEMAAEVREAVRQPMQERIVRLRSRGTDYTYPANCLLVAARNACRCGRLTEDGQGCTCTTAELQRYRGRISEPLLDRFDLFCTVSRISAGTWERPTELVGQNVQTLINQAWERQRARYGRWVANGTVESTELRRLASLHTEAEALITRASEQYFLSPRGVHKIIAVARTIADLAGEKLITPSHVYEALFYRQRQASP